jgi:hypothetical protein
MRSICPLLAIGGSIYVKKSNLFLLAAAVVTMMVMIAPTASTGEVKELERSQKAW